MHLKDIVWRVENNKEVTIRTYKKVLINLKKIAKKKKSENTEYGRVIISDFSNEVFFFQRTDTAERGS